MTSVDNKVVSISFDNANFSQRIQDTIGALEKLRGSLNMSGATKGISELGAAAKSLDMTPMATSIEGINAKFAAMASIGITAIANLTNRIVDAGLQISKAFAITPITDGFAEFELKMGSIQTIMAGSGESMETVNEKLKELNEYSDKTIYSFKDMTSNIGKFTNAGVSLDQSVAAIQGVANVAALSGANAEEASRAMYNFAQAISTGSVKLIDWKSIELANMGTVEFKQQLIDTAVAMGTLTQAADGTYKTLKGTDVTTSNFNTTLNEAWLTSEALTTTLERFSDTTTDIGKRATAAATEIKTFSQLMDTIKESMGSGWAQSFEYVIGNFEQGKQLFGVINAAFGGIIQQSADARNKMLKDWADLGGWEEMFGGIIHFYQGIKSYVVPIRDAFREIFPRTTGKTLYEITVAFKKFAEGMKASGDTASRIKGFFKGIFGILSIGWEVVKGVARVFFALVGAIWKVVTPLFRLVSVSGALGSGLHALLVESGAIKKFFDALVWVITKVGDVLGGAVSFVVDFILKLGMVTKLFTPIKALGSLIVDFVSGFGLLGKASGAVDGLGAKISGFIGNLDILGKSARFLDNLSEKITNFAASFDAVSAGQEAFAKLASVFKKVKAAVWDFFGGIDYGPFLYAMEATTVIAKGAIRDLSAIFVRARDAAWAFFSGLSFGPVLDFLASAVNKAGDAIESFFGLFGGKGSSSGTEAMVRAEYANARFGRSLALTTDSAEKGTSIFERLANTIGGFIESLSSGGGNAFDSLSEGLVNAIKNLPGAIKDAFSGISADSLFNILKTGALGGALVYVVRFLKDTLGGGLFKTIKRGIRDTVDALTGSLEALQTNIKADTLRKIAISIGLLALAMVGLSFIDPAALAQGLIGVTAGLGALLSTMVAMDKLVKNMGSAKMAAVGVAFVGMAAAMTLMAGAVYLFSRMNPEELTRGIIGVGATLIVMSGAIRLMNNQTDNVIQASIAMGIMAVSLLALAVTIQRYADMDLKTVGEGLAYMAVALGGIIYALRFMPKDVIDKAAGLFILAFALKQLLNTIKIFADVEWGILSKGILSIAIALGLIGGAMRAFPKDMMKQAIALGVVGISLNIIAMAIKEVGSMNVDQIVAAVGGLSVMLLALAIAVSYFDKFKGGIVPLLGAAAALYVLGQTVKVVGSMPFGDVVKGVGAIVLALAAVGIVGGLVAGPLTLLGIAFGLLGLGLLAAGTGAFLFAKAFKLAAEAGKDGIKILMNGLKGFIRELPSLITAFVQGLIDAFVELGKRAPEVLGVFEQLFVELLKIIQRQVPKIIKVAGELLSALLKEIRKRFPELVDTGYEILLALLSGLSENIHEIGEKAVDIVTGFVDVITENMPRVVDSGINFLLSFLSAITERIGEVVTAGVDLLVALLRGISENLDRVVSAVFDLITSLIEAISDNIQLLIDAGFNVLTSFLGGITDNLVEVISAVTEVITTFITEVGNSAEEIAEAGLTALGDFLSGFVDNLTEVVNTVGEVVGKFITEVGNQAEELAVAGGAALADFLNGVSRSLGLVIVAGTMLVIKMIQGIGQSALLIATAAMDVVIDFIDGLSAAIDEKGPELRAAGTRLAGSVADGLTFGWAGKIRGFFRSVGGSWDKLEEFNNRKLEVRSPSKLYYRLGQNLIAGLTTAFDRDRSLIRSSDAMTDELIRTLVESITKASRMVETLDANPVITPVLDLTRVRNESKKVGGMLSSATIRPGVSFDRARVISSATTAVYEDSAPTTPEPREIKFEQNIYAPEALSANDIYRNTKSQIALAKEELGIS